MLLDTRRQELWDISRYSENLNNNFSTFPVQYVIILLLSNRRRKRLPMSGYLYQRHRWQIFSPFLLVLLISVANMPPVSTIPAANCHSYQWHQRQIWHRCKRHRWQTMGTIIKLLTTTLNWTWKKCIYFLTPPPKGVQKKSKKNFLIEDFLHFPLVSTTPVETLSCEYLHEFSKKF